MNTEDIYQSALLDELQKIAEDKNKPSALKKALKIGAGAAGLAASGGLAYSALRKKPGLIKKVFKKDYKPRMMLWGDSAKDLNVMERASQKAFSPGNKASTKFFGKYNAGTKVGKDEIGLYHGRATYGKRKASSRHISAPGQKAIIESEDKYKYGKKLHKAGVGAKTWKLEKGDIKKLKGMKRDEDAVNYLDKKYGKDKFIFKPRDDSGVKLPATMGTNSLVHSQSLAKGKKSQPAKMVKYIRKSPEHFIGQEKMNIKKEYRVRTVDGKALGITNRYPSKLTQKILQKSGLLGESKQSIGFLPVTRKFGKGKEIADFVNKNPKAFNLKSGKKGINTMAFDVAETVDSKGKKSFKVIEANTTSGADLDNPYMAGKLYKKLTGKASGLEKKVKYTGAGALAAASAVPLATSNK